MKCAAFALSLLVLPTAFGADWPQWRGPDRNGTSAETSWTAEWPADGPPVAWKAKVGLGMAGFVVAGGRAFTTGHAEGTDTIFCFEAATGKELWKHTYPAELGDKFYEGGTTGTPTIEGDRLYHVSRWGDAFCLEAATGKVVWSANFQKETGVRVPTWGFTGAPVVLGPLLILNVGDAGLALDKSSGKVAWKSADQDAGYSTALPLKRGDAWLAILGNGTSYVAVDPTSGREAWRVKWLTEYGVNAADPVVSGERMFISSGYGKGGAVFDITSNEPKQVWKSKVLRTQLNAAVLHEGHLYGVDGDTTEKATLKCVEFATGTEKWAEKNFGSGAVIVADGKLIALSGFGELSVAPATPTGFAPLSRVQVLGGKCWTAPVLANGRIYCRNSRGDVAVLDVSGKR